MENKVMNFRKMLEEEVANNQRLQQTIQQSNVKIEQLRGAIFALEEVINEQKSSKASEDAS